MFNKYQFLLSLPFCLFDEERGKKDENFRHGKERQLECQSDSDAALISQEVREPMFLNKWYVKFKVHKSFIHKTVYLLDSKAWPYLISLSNYMAWWRVENSEDTNQAYRWLNVDIVLYLKGLILERPRKESLKIE